MQPWRIANTQVTDSAQPESVSDVSLGSEVRILATTLPQFFWARTSPHPTATSATINDLFSRLTDVAKLESQCIFKQSTSTT
jgi:hypothetical protein